MDRILKFTEAMREAMDMAMAADPAVFLIGEGVPDPKGIFGTSLGLAEKYGSERVLDMPLSEEGMTGMIIGAALHGLRPVLTHQRLDFALYSMNQIVNNAAKWHYIFGGQQPVPLVIRLVVGMGWGQGAQHSQSLHSWFSHVPGLKVVMPTTPRAAKGLLLASIEDPNPVIFIEHRWLHGASGPVPEGYFTLPIGREAVSRPGEDITILATSYLAVEAKKAADRLAELAISAELIEIQSLRPLDAETLIRSAKKTGHVIVADAGWRPAGFAAEILALLAETCIGELKNPPRRLTFPDCPTPTSHALANRFYPRAEDILEAACRMLGVDPPPLSRPERGSEFPADVPDPSSAGPF